MTNMFDLQLFAEGDAAEVSAPAPADAAPAGDVAAEPEAKAEMTEIDVDAKINAAISKITARLEADYKRRELAAKKEAERLGKLSDEERREAELENYRKELESQRAEFEREKLKYETAQVLSQRGLDVGLAEFVIAEDSEITLNRIKLLEKIMKKGIQDGINEALKGKAPATSGKIIDSNTATNTGSIASVAEAIRANQLRK